MRREFDCLSFDCYGTLIDWRRGIVAAFSRLVEAHDQQLEELDGERILDLHARIEPEVEAAGFLPYREVLDRVAARILDELGLEVPVRQQDFLSSSLPTWPPFPDTAEALVRLAAAGYRLGILSNVDDDLLAATLRPLPVDFELLVTAEQVRSYKPATAHFREARRRWKGKRWLHVAQSLFHDVEPAIAERIPVVWINRLADVPPPALEPQGQFPDLATFANHLIETGRLTAS